MNNPLIMLVGGPESGKTNFIGGLWKTLLAREGMLQTITTPENIEYIDGVIAHQLSGAFAPRSDTNTDIGQKDFSIAVNLTGVPLERHEILIPDISGELWQTAVQTLELSDEWMSQLKAANAALLFVGIHSSLNVTPPDWVTAGRRLSGLDGLEEDAEKLPTQVFLCELLRFLEETLSVRDDGSLPKVAVIATAWDKLDRDAYAMSPLQYLRTQFPLFAGRIEGAQNVEIRVFGTSAVGGDLQDDSEFKEKFLQEEISGYVVMESKNKVISKPDLTIPIAWIIGADIDDN